MDYVYVGLCVRKVRVRVMAMVRVRVRVRVSVSVSMGSMERQRGHWRQHGVCTISGVPTGENIILC